MAKWVSSYLTKVGWSVGCLKSFGDLRIAADRSSQENSPMLLTSDQHYLLLIYPNVNIFVSQSQAITKTQPWLRIKVGKSFGQSEKHVEKSKSPAYGRTQLALITMGNSFPWLRVMGWRIQDSGCSRSLRPLEVQLNFILRLP